MRRRNVFNKKNDNEQLINPSTSVVEYPISPNTEWVHIENNVCDINDAPNTTKNSIELIDINKNVIIIEEKDDDKIEESKEPEESKKPEEKVIGYHITE